MVSRTAVIESPSESESLASTLVTPPVRVVALTSSLTLILSATPTAGKENVILLEEKGENLDSVGYAKKMKQWRLSSHDVHLVVGPPGGFEFFSLLPAAPLTTYTGAGQLV